MFEFKTVAELKEAAGKYGNSYLYPYVRIGDVLLRNGMAEAEVLQILNFLNSKSVEYVETFRVLVDEKKCSVEIAIQELAGLTEWQIKALNEHWNEGLRGDHLRSWQAPIIHSGHRSAFGRYHSQYEFSKGHYDALFYALSKTYEKGKHNPAKAIKEINWLTTEGARLYREKDGMKKNSLQEVRNAILPHQYLSIDKEILESHEYSGLNEAEEQTLETLYNFGFTKNMFIINWRLDSSQIWGENHESALISIVINEMAKQGLLAGALLTAHELDTPPFMNTDKEAFYATNKGRQKMDAASYKKLRHAQETVLKASLAELKELNAEQCKILRRFYAAGLRGADVRKVTLESLSILSELVDKLNFSSEDAVNIFRACFVTKTIYQNQYALLKELYQYGLRLEHLTQWQATPGETWQGVQNFALAHLIVTLEVTPQKAIHEISNLTADQVQILTEFYATGLRNEDFQEVTAGSIPPLAEELKNLKESQPEQFASLKVLYQDGVRLRHLKHWEPVPGERWGKEQHKALMALLREQSLLPREAIMEISKLHSAKLALLVKLYAKNLRGSDLGDVPIAALPLLEKLITENNFTIKDAVYAARHNLSAEKFAQIKNDLAQVGLETKDWCPLIDPKNWEKTHQDALMYLTQTRDLSAKDALVEISFLTKDQVQTLLTFYENGLRGMHLKTWELLSEKKWENNNASYLVLMELIVKQGLKPADAILKIVGLDSSQMRALIEPAKMSASEEPFEAAGQQTVVAAVILNPSARELVPYLSSSQIMQATSQFDVLQLQGLAKYYKDGGRQEDLNRLNLWQQRALAQYYQYGLRVKDLLDWKRAPTKNGTENFGEAHFKAMQFLATPQQSGKGATFFSKPDPVTALKRINGLTNDQAQDICAQFTGKREEPKQQYGYYSEL